MEARRAARLRRIARDSEAALRAMDRLRVDLIHEATYRYHMGANGPTPSDTQAVLRIDFQRVEDRLTAARRAARLALEHEGEPLRFERVKAAPVTSSKPTLMEQYGGGAWTEATVEVTL